GSAIPASASTILPQSSLVWSTRAPAASAPGLPDSSRRAVRIPRIAANSGSLSSPASRSRKSSDSAAVASGFRLTGVIIYFSFHHWYDRDTTQSIGAHVAHPPICQGGHRRAIAAHPSSRVAGIERAASAQRLAAARRFEVGQKHIFVMVSQIGTVT